MKRILRSSCCCRSDEEAEVDVDADLGSHWNICNSRGHLKQHEQGTLSTVVTTEPSGSVSARNSLDDFVDIDFPQGSYEEDRFSDMSATIFKRQHK